MKRRNIPWVVSVYRPTGSLRHWGGAADPRDQVVSEQQELGLHGMAVVDQVSHLIGSTKRNINQINRSASGDKLQRLGVTSSLA
jgi:hypothetical protein